MASRVSGIEFDEPEDGRDGDCAARVGFELSLARDWEVVVEPAARDGSLERTG
jgi:hypothetical protein